MSWVHAYREALPAADSWARGLRRVQHSVETQERVFRMAEYLAGRGVSRGAVFLALEEADRCVALGECSDDAARAGYRAIASLFPVKKRSIVICGSGTPDLSAFGFDPIAFDGNDPAAYAWIVFELTLRAASAAEAEAARCSCHDGFVSTAIGVARV